MPSIAVLHGKEGTFPYDLIAYIEDNAPKGVSIDRIEIGAVASSDKLPYDVIVDRISHCVPFYREVMRHACLTGVYVINNPFRAVPEKFFGNSVALKLGIDVPETVVLPMKEWPDYIENGDLLNLQYPLDWSSIVEKTGFPAVLKPVFGGGWRDVYIVNDMDELFSFYDRSGRKLMMLQQFINYTDYLRAIVVGKKYVRLAYFDPRHKAEPSIKAYPERELPFSNDFTDSLIEKSCRLCRALDYDVNSVEWAVRDGKAYAIDFCNQVPDARRDVINPKNYDWFVEKMGDFAIECALKKPRLSLWNSLDECMF